MHGFAVYGDAKEKISNFALPYLSNRNIESITEDKVIQSEISNTLGYPAMEGNKFDCHFIKHKIVYSCFI